LLSDELVTSSVTYRDSVAVLAVCGEIDLASAPTFERALAEILSENPPSLIVDLLGVHFLGSIGVAILMTARDKFGDRGPFSVVAQGANTSRIIQLLALDNVVALHETIEEALRPENRAENEAIVRQR
jgi:anti-anti-sigma factor